MLLRITVGGVIGVAVLLVLALLWTRALELLNARSDLSVATGAVLLIATPAIAITIIYFGVRKLLIVGSRDEDHAPANLTGEGHRAVCASLFAEDIDGAATPPPRVRVAPERKRKAR